MVIHYEFYYLGLNDLSTNGQLLNIPLDTFNRQNDGSSECMIYSGIGVTHLIRLTYYVVKETMIHYLDELGLKKVECEYDWFWDHRDSSDQTCLRCYEGGNEPQSRRIGTQEGEHEYDPSSGLNLETCYKIRDSFDRFPLMTFHFSGRADWMVGWETLLHLRWSWCAGVLFDDRVDEGYEDHWSVSID